MVFFLIKYIHIFRRSYFYYDGYAVMRFQIIMCVDLAGQWNVE